MTNEYLDYLHHEALKLLNRKGVEAEGYILSAVEKLDGVVQKGNRLFFDSEVVEDVLQKNYCQLLEHGSGLQHSADIITIGVCDMPQYYMKPLSDEIQIMTVESLIESTKFLESSQQTSKGVWSMVPGVPRDVPSQLQAITEFYIGCEYCSNGGNVDTMHPEEAVDIISEMAIAMGGNIDSIGMFTISPMRLGGFEMETAIKNIDKFKSFEISSLPTPAATAPIFITAAWIVSIAEVLAGAVVLYLLSGGKSVFISTGMFPFEPRKMWVAGGMPEHSIMEYQRSIIAKRYNPHIYHTHSMTTSAKQPSAQAAMEKTMGATFAVQHGCRDFNTAGLLSFDDIFSPTQFVIDIEIRNTLYTYINGQTMPKEYQSLDMDWRDIIDEGLENGYTAADTTLNHYKDSIYFSELLNRDVFQKNLIGSDGIFGTDMVKTAQEKACDCINNYNYKPEENKIMEVRRIFNKAWEKFSNSEENPFKNVCF